MKSRLPVIRRALSTVLLLAAASAGCADPADPADETAPLVVATMPAADQTGVPASETIVVTFSEQMDPPTVEAAYSSVELPLEMVSFAWSAGGTVLTISPAAPLLYAEGTGTDPAAVTPRAYAITLGADAADLAGNPLGTALELSFSTRRRLVTSFGLDLPLTYVYRDGTNQGSNTEIWAGDNVNDATYRSYLSFDLTTLPAGSEIESAQLSARQLAADGVPYTLGEVVAQHVTFTDGNGLGALVPHSIPGVFSADAVVESKLLSVTSQVSEDVVNRAARGDRSQYRLQIDTATNADGIMDRAVFAKNTFELTTVYVVD